MLETDEEIRVRITAETQSIIEAGKRIDALKSQIIEMATKTKRSFQEVANGMREAFKQATLAAVPRVQGLGGVLTPDPRGLAQANESIKRYNKDLALALSLTKENSTTMQRFGGIIKNAFSFFLGGSIFYTIMRLIRGFQELARVGEDYAMTIYRVGVSINQLQRRGMDITVKSEIALIKELQQQYSMFSKRSVIDAVASVQMLTRNFGFNQEQIKKTIQLSMDLAIVQGKDVAETAKMLALFYSSGYGEGLQHAGLAVNRMTVAQEALRMGFEKTYMQLTEIERASAAYALVERQTSDLHEDATKIQEGLIGKIKEQRSAIENVTNEIALRALPVELAWLKIKRASIEAIADWITWDKLYKEALQEEGKSYKPFLSRWFLDKTAAAKADKELKDQREQWEKILSETLDVPIDINLDITGESDQEAAQARADLGDSIIEAWNDLINEKAEYDRKSEELEADHTKREEEIDQSSIDKRIELWRDYQKDLANIEKDLAQTIADYQTDFARDSIDLDKEYQLSIQDANRKYHEQELKAERDYQERLKRLREEFLFDLEDALRERDALQVLRLIRRYNLDVQQEKDGYAEQRKEAARAHKLELEDLARQHVEKEQQARESLARQIEDAKAAAEQKRQDALDSYDAALTEAEANWSKQKEEEDAKYQERQDALTADLLERQTKILEAFGVEIGTTGTSLDTVATLFKAYLGSKGVVAGVIDEYLAKINGAAVQTDADIQIMMKALAKLQELKVAITAAAAGEVPIPNPNPEAHASGGTLLLTRPHLFMAGEAPEKVEITPLSQLNSRKLGGKGTGGKGTLEVHLGEGLIGQIIDNTMEEMSIVITEGR